MWEVEDKRVVEQAKSLYDIEIWKVQDILNELLHEVGTKSYRDDVLRTVQLISTRGQ